MQLIVFCLSHKCTAFTIEFLSIWLNKFFNMLRANPPAAASSVDTLIVNQAPFFFLL